MKETLTQMEISARETLYQSANEDGATLLLLKTLANVGIPVIFLMVQLAFWTVGMSHIYSHE
jgi:hypothetical protein